MKQTISFLFIIFSVHQSAFGQQWFRTGQRADLMLSGVDFNNTGGPLLYNHPSGIASNGTKFLVCDRFNNRVLVWNSPPAQWNTPPDFVLGQQNFITNDPGTTKSQMNWPGNSSVAASGALIVADTDNDRALIWNQFPTQNGETANVEINLAQIGGGYGWPWGVWTDGTRLAVVATQGSAILFWNAIPTVDNQQPSYTIRLPQFGTPRNISTDGSTFFFIGDHNARVNGNPGTFFWNSYPTNSNQPYDFYRDEWIKGVKLTDGKLVAGGLMNVYIWNTVPTSSTQNPNVTLRSNYYSNGDGPDIVYAGGRLYANNYNGNNVHVFNSVPISSGAQPDFAIGSPAVNVNTLDSINYLQNPVPATDGTRFIASSDFDRELWIWNSPPTRSGAAPDRKISLLGIDLAPWDNALHGGRLVLAGKRKVAIWLSLPVNGELPSRVFSNAIGTATFQELKGVALDSLYLYLADANGSVFVWNGLPTSGAENPFRTISISAMPVNHLHSDGTYLTVAVDGNPPTIFIYRVADITAGGAIQPWKTVTRSAQLPLNLATSAITFDGAFAIANKSGNAVYVWRDVNDAGNPNSVVVLGQTDLRNTRASIGVDRLFMPASLAAHGNKLWVGETKFSSRIVQFSKENPAEVNDESKSPSRFALEQSYPNPFNPATTIRYDLPSTSLVSLKVFDILGREVRTLVNEVQDAGFKSVKFDASSFASGVYFYTLRAGGLSATRKLLLIR